MPPPFDLASRAAWPCALACLAACAGVTPVELAQIPGGERPESRGDERTGGNPTDLPTLDVTVPPAPQGGRERWDRGALDADAAPVEIDDWPADFDRSALFPEVLPDPEGVDLSRYFKYLARDWRDGEDTFSDLAAGFAAVHADDAAVDELLERLDASDRDAVRSLVPMLTELVRSSFLHSNDWRAARTESRSGRRDDAILDGSPLSWRDHEVLQQAALVFAPVETVLEVERDYAAQTQFVGQDAVDIFPIASSHRVSRDADGRQQRFVDVLFHKDLGFLLGELTYVLRHVDRIDDGGDLVTDNYAPAQKLRGSSFKWLAGRNTYLELATSSGRTVGTIVVVQLTFDIDGLWESNGNRREAIRFSLGNLKRTAERRAATTMQPTSERQ